MTPRTGLAVVLAVAFLLRAGIAVRLAPIMQVDTGEYLAVAENLVRTGTFSNIDDISNRLEPYAFRMPLFQSLIAALSWLTGVDPRWTVIGMNFPAALGTVALAFWMGQTLGNGRTALAAGLLVALSPSALLNTSTVLTDTVFALLFTVATALGLLVTADPTVPRCAGWGLACGLATMTRPIAKYFWFPAGLFILWRAGPSARTGKLILAFVLAFALLPLPWIFRNWTALGFAGLELNLGVNLMWSRTLAVEPPTAEDRRADPVQARVQEICTRERRPLVLLHAVREETGMSMVAADRELQRLGVRTILRHPAHAVKSVLLNLTNNLTGPAYIQSFARELGLAPPDVEASFAQLKLAGRWEPMLFNLTVRLLQGIVFVALPLIGLAVCLRNPERRPFGIYLALLFLYYLGLTSVVNGNVRYLLAIEAPLVALAALGAQRLL